MTDEQAYDMGYQHGWNRERPDGPSFGFSAYISGYAQGAREKDEAESEEEAMAELAEKEGQSPGFVEPSPEEKREALRKSWQHWEENVLLQNKGLRYDDTAESCACCKLAAQSQGIQVGSLQWEDGDYTCHGCPIYDYTGRQNCDGTPYDELLQTGAKGMAKWLRQLLNGEKPEISGEDDE